MLTGRVARARAVLVGWLSAFAHPGELRRARCDDAAHAPHRRRRRARPDDPRQRASAPVHARTRARGGAARRCLVADARAHGRGRAPAAPTPGDHRSGPRGAGAVRLAVSCSSGHVPEVGSFQAWPGVGAAWSTFSGSWRTTMMGAARPATPAFGLMAAAGAVLFGHPGLARSLVVGGALPLGAFGAYRLVRPFAASSLPGIAAAAAYAANPIARERDLPGRARSARVLRARAVRARRVRPGHERHDTRRDPGDRRGRRVRHRRLSSASDPRRVLGRAPRRGDRFGVAAGTAARAGDRDRVLHRAPVHGRRAAGRGCRGRRARGATRRRARSCSRRGRSRCSAPTRRRSARNRASSLSFATILRFHTGRAGAGIAPWGIVAAAVVPLAIATGPRLRWAMRAWVLAAISFAVAWLPGRISAGATVARARRRARRGGDRSRVRGRARCRRGARRPPPVPLRLAPGHADRRGRRPRPGRPRVLGRHLLRAATASAPPTGPVPIRG